MTDFHGVYPAFYACYSKNGDICTDGIKKYTQYLIEKNVNGLYVGGSSGECIYQSKEERKIVLEAVMEVVKGTGVKVIAHVACNNTKDSMELAAHAQGCKVDAIAAIPPIYFHLPPAAIAKYWNDISSSAPDTDFIIYNIPQLAGVALTERLLSEMVKNKRVVGVKNSSVSTCDIMMWRSQGMQVFNGPDDQMLPGLSAGACGGIGGTYGIMPELFVALYKMFNSGDNKSAIALQDEITKIVLKLVSSSSSMYAIAKHVVLLREGIDIGDVRDPLPKLDDAGKIVAQEIVAMIGNALQLIK